jgi:hypothetical protein
MAVAACLVTGCNSGDTAAPPAPVSEDPPVRQLATEAAPHPTLPPATEPLQAPLEPVPGTTNLCNLPEKVVFTCQLAESTKVVSLCGSEDFTRTSGTLQYRFGRRGGLELAYPEVTEGSRDAFTFDASTNDGGDVDELTVRFENGGHTYRISQEIGWHFGHQHNRMPMPGGAGVSVQTGGEVVAELFCDAELATSLIPLFGL